MNRILFSLFFTLAFMGNLFSQTAQLGNPRTWSLKQADQISIETLQLPAFDLNAQLRLDAVNEANKVGPWKFGYEHHVSKSIDNSGTWSVLPNGDRVWRIIFRSNAALSMNVVFDQFKIPQGATLYIYNEEKTQYEGAYTAANNNQDEMLGTSLIEGSNIVIEYVQPQHVTEMPKLRVGTVVHGYKSLSVYARNILKALNDSGNCNQDVKCPLGSGWEDQINSVAIIIVGGSGACTGALVNNTAQNGIPYFLSANHCGTTGLGTWVFRFNWDSPVAVCSQNANSQDPGAPYNQVNGATLRANSAGSDFCLMQLNATPTGNIYYAGWNRGTTAATQATAIHHPSGDVKKISRENNALTTATWSGAQTWRVANWDQGTTEPGSSGSPLFDQNKLIIGQLYGGGAACSGLINNNQPDYYGRFDISWTGGNTNSTRLRNWLDPTNSGATTQNGYNPNASNLSLDAGLTQANGISGTYCNQSTFTPQVVLKNFGSITVNSATINYRVDANPISNFAWSGTLAPNASTTVTLPSVSVSTGGAHTFGATVTLPNSQVDSNALNNTVSSNFNVILNGQTAVLTVRPDCWGSEITWEIRQGAAVIYSGGPYTDQAATQITNQISSLCLSPGCYVFAINDDYGDGIEGSAYAQCGVDGNYFILDPNGDTVVIMSNANYGNGTTHNFCITAPTGLEENFNFTDFQVYPNPNNGIFQLKLQTNIETRAKLECMNSLGQTIQVQNFDLAKEWLSTYDLSNQSAGVYLIRVTLDNGQILSKKVVKQ